MQVTVIGMLFSPAMHLHFNFPGKFAAKVFDVNSGASINVWRVLPAEQSYAQCQFLPVDFAVPSSRDMVTPHSIYGAATAAQTDARVTLTYGLSAGLSAA